MSGSATPAPVVVDALPGLEGHTSVLVGDYMIAYGGKTGPMTLNAQTYALNLTSLVWQRLRCAGSVPLARAYHSAAVHEQRMYVFGGLLAVGVDDIHYNAYNVFCNVDALDEGTLKLQGQHRKKQPQLLRKVLQQKKESASLHCLDMRSEPTWNTVLTAGCIPPTRSHHSSLVYRGQLYVVGGYSVHTTGRSTDEELKALSLVYQLNLATNVWTAVDPGSSSAPQRWGSAAVGVGDLWLFMGGVDYAAEPSSKEDNAVCGWHLEEREWRWLAKSAIDGPPARAMHTAIRWGAHVIVFGGAADVTSILFNDCFAFDIFKGTWTAVLTKGDRPLARCGHQTVVVGDKMFVFGGMDHSFFRATRVWVLSLTTWEWSTATTSFSAKDLINVRGVPTDKIGVVQVVEAHRSTQAQSHD